MLFVIYVNLLCFVIDVISFAIAFMKLLSIYASLHVKYIHVVCKGFVQSMIFKTYC